MFSDLISRLVMKISKFIWRGLHPKMTDQQFLEKEIDRWKLSPHRTMHIKRFRY